MEDPLSIFVWLLPRFSEHQKYHHPMHMHIHDIVLVLAYVPGYLHSGQKHVTSVVERTLARNITASPRDLVFAKPTGPYHTFPLLSIFPSPLIDPCAFDSCFIQ